MDARSIGGQSGETSALAENFESGSDQLDDDLYVPFTLTAPRPSELAVESRQLTHRIAGELAAAAPADWQRLDAVFALTVTVGGAEVSYSTADGEPTVRTVPASVLALARDHRDLSARLSAEPWWRMTIQLDNAGELVVDYDYGDDEPFPDGQLFAPDEYRADLATYPRARLPVWLAAYVSENEQQIRTPARAAYQVRSATAGRIGPIRATDEFPVLSATWSRWVTLAATSVATGSPQGPRVLPSLCWFEDGSRNGSTLYLLSGGRGVLSGGQRVSPELDAAYNGRSPMPDLYRGAPAWVANPVLNPRAAGGLLSFCYWWDGGDWYRGDSPSSTRFGEAVPGIWSTDIVIELVAARVAPEPHARLRGAVRRLLAAAEAGAVTPEAIAAVFPDDGRFDLDSAFYQFELGGLAAGAMSGGNRML